MTNRTIKNKISKKNNNMMNNQMKRSSMNTKIVLIGVKNMAKKCLKIMKKRKNLSGSCHSVYLEN